MFSQICITYISYQPNFSDTESDTFLIPNFIDTHWSLDHWQKIISSEKYNDIGSWDVLRSAYRAQLCQMLLHCNSFFCYNLILQFTSMNIRHQMVAPQSKGWGRTLIGKEIFLEKFANSGNDLNPHMFEFNQCLEYCQTFGLLTPKKRNSPSQKMMLLKYEKDSTAESHLWVAYHIGANPKMCSETKLASDEHYILVWCAPVLGVKFWQLLLFSFLICCNDLELYNQLIALVGCRC